MTLDISWAESGSEGRRFHHASISHQKRRSRLKCLYTRVRVSTPPQHPCMDGIWTVQNKIAWKQTAPSRKWGMESRPSSWGTKPHFTTCRFLRHGYFRRICMIILGSANQMASLTRGLYCLNVVGRSWRHPYSRCRVRIRQLFFFFFYFSQIYHYQFHNWISIK